MSADVRPVGAAAAARAVLEARGGGPAVAVVTRVDEEPGDRRVLVPAEGEPVGTLGDARLDRAAGELGRTLIAGEGDDALARELEDPPATLYGEVHRAPARLVIVGAGHISVPLARLGDLAGFPVVVLDDRDDFADEERFPPGARVHRVDFADPFAGLTVSARDSVVLVTRAHRYDFDCLRALLDAPHPPRYIGMVGSRRRVRAAFAALLEAGVEPDRLRGVRAPIGVDIGAETPEEIAVSIAAELVAVRRGVEARGSLRDVERVVERFLTAGTDGDGA